MGLPAHTYRAWNIGVLAYMVERITLFIMPRWVVLELSLVLVQAISFEVPRKSNPRERDVKLFYEQFCL
jgi:hypothetical protein